MKCNDCQEALSAYYDKILDQEQTAAVEAHLEECQHCQRAYRQLEAVLGCLKDKEEIAVPPLLHKQMLEGVAKQAQRDKVRKLWPRRMAGMAAALLVGVSLITTAPLDISKWAATDESQALADSASEETSKNADANQEAYAEDMAGAARIVPQTGISHNEEETETTNEIGEEAVQNNISETAYEASEAGTMQIQMDTRNISGLQVWEIETEDVEELTQYLKDYAADEAGQVQANVGENISFIVYGIADASALFEALQGQSFTRSLKLLEETGENIKIVVKA